MPGTHATVCAEEAATSDRILAHVIEAVARSPVAAAPFRHIYLEQVFPDAVYRRLLDALPDAAVYRADNPAKYTRPDGQCSRQVLALDRGMPAGASTDDTVWAAVTHALMSPALQRAICARFGLRETDRHGRPTSTARPLLVRDLPGYWIEPHPDSRAKQVTMQCYLARDRSQAGLGTTLYALRPFRPSVWVGRERAMRVAGRLPFLPNTGYAFPVRWNSFHGVERLPDAAGVRHTLMNTFYWNRSGS
jgi:hypothetical protein